MRYINKLTDFIKRTDKIFLGLVFFTAVIDLPFFLNIVLPLHDTMYIYHVFHFFYNELFWQNEIARWLPFGYYGIHSDLQFISLTPITYMVGILGWVLRVKDTLLLFKIIIFLEQMLLLFGTYIFSISLFRRRMVAAVVSLAVIGSSAIISQISWNFHIFYLLPLILYFVVRFSKDLRPQYLVIAMIIFMASTFGITYVSILNSLMVAIFGVVLLLCNFSRWRKLRDITRRDVILSGLLVLVLFIYVGSTYYVGKGAMNFTEIFSIGRDPITGVTDLSTFLSYGGHIGISKFEDLFSPKHRLMDFMRGITAYDLSLYMGLIPLVFVLIGVIRFRYPVYLSLVSVAVVMGLFSMGGRFPEFLYNYFPPIKYFRHIGLAASGLKVLLPVLAGYGITLIMNWVESKDEKLNARRSLVPEAIVAGVLLTSGVLHYEVFRAVIHPHYYKAATIYGAVVAVLVAVLFLIRKRFKASKHFVLFVALCMMAEIFIYQAELTHGVKAHADALKPLKEDAVSVSEYGYQGVRTLAPIPGRTVDAIPLVWRTTPYNFAYNFLQWDPCVIMARTDNLNSLVATLIKVRGGNFDYMQVHMPKDDFLLNALACNSSKLKIYSKVIYKDNMSDSIKTMAGELPKDTLMLSMISPEEKIADSPGTIEGTIKVTAFRANELDLDAEAPPGGGWLYYSDAWHPYWKARVNGKNSDVAIANLAFKAVRLKGGHNKVSFYIDGGLSSVCLAMIIVIGLTIAIVLLSSIIMAVIRPDMFYKDSQGAN